MNGTSFLALVQNTALLLAAALVFDVAASRWRVGQSSCRQALVGCTLGAIGIAVMLTPWTLSPGIVFDARSILIGISGLFCGTLATLVAMAMTAAFRFHQGGAGVWTGIAVILTSGAIGILWRHHGRRRLEEISWRELYLFGLAVHLAMLSMMLTLPWEAAPKVLSAIALPVLLIYPPGTALLGVLMVNRLRRERAEAALKESRDKYRLLAENVSDVIFVLDMRLHCTYVSPSVRLLRGYEPEEVLRQTIFDALTPASRERVMQVAPDAQGAAKPGQDDVPESRTLQLEMRRKDGTTVWTEVKLSLIRDESRRAVGILGVTRDITKRRQIEAAQARLMHILESSLNEIYVFDAASLVFEYVNQGALRNLGYTSEAMRRMTPLDLKPEFTEDTFRRAIIPLLNHDQKQLIFDTVHRRTDGSRYPVEVHLQLVEFEDQRLFLAVILDITERKRSEERLQQTLESLRKAFSTTVQVMVSAVEARDPYTAGHQLRSADLARAIATEMGLPQETVDGIRMAGSIHDIGKLSIPAELLSKPTKLTDLEYSLIKEHPRSGYEILKDVESPWPLAQIVYQHHERMNGSGYPRNLKGDEILLEARILAVSDVVESMASHRPYRPALGIGAALEEIEKNRGILYDHAVADACLRLLRDKGYQLR